MNRHEPLRMNLKEVLRTVAASAVLVWGLLAHAITGKTSSKAYQALIWLFCATGGRLNRFLSRLIALARPARPIEKPVGVLGDLSGTRAAELAEVIGERGYVVFERALPPEICDRLAEFAKTTPAKVRRMDGQAAPLHPVSTLYSGEAPAAVRYDYDPAALLNNADVQNLLADRSLLRLAQEYLGCQPTADVLSMWWHTNFHAQPDSEAAQYYHFDMDRIKWFKVFIYLTDVGPDNGPHSFVVGSHRDGGIPWNLRRRGYVRLMDDEVLSEYGPERCIEFSAPRGSIIVEDTRGLHKGNAVRGEPRLILQLQFSNSLFGGYYPPARVSQVRSPDFAARLKEMPATYRQYV